jgi:putative FmdB family regulatory protein
MPTYEYVCTSCGHRFDAFLRIGDDPPSVCQRCGRATLRKVFHPAGIVFKGSGFYATDARRKAAADKDGGQKKSEDGGGKKAEKKAESKPPADGSEKTG